MDQTYLLIGLYKVHPLEEFLGRLRKDMESSFWLPSNDSLGTLSPPGKTKDLFLKGCFFFPPGASPTPSKLRPSFYALILSANATPSAGHSHAFHTVRGHRFSTQHTLPHFFP